MRTLKIMLLCCPLLLVACKGRTNRQPAVGQDSVAQAVVTDDRRSPGAPDTVEELKAGFMGTFSGTLPCADCGGIVTTLTLNSDGTYVLETEYLGKGDNKFTDTGKWTPSEDLAFVELNYDRKSDGAPVYYALIDKDTLEKLDIHAKPIVSEANYRLSRK